MISTMCLVDEMRICDALCLIGRIEMKWIHHHKCFIRHLLSGTHVSPTFTSSSSSSFFFFFFFFFL